MLNYKVNDKNTLVDGTSLKGFVTTTYDNLVKTFGNPKQGSADGKTTCEWLFEFEDGTVATIYDWKTKSTPKELYKWNIGGHTYKALELLQQTINAKIQTFVF